MIEENLIQISGEIMINVCKKRHACEKDYAWTPSTRNCENGKYIASIMDNSVITCNEVIESYDEEEKN